MSLGHELGRPSMKRQNGRPPLIAFHTRNINRRESNQQANPVRERHTIGWPLCIFWNDQHSFFLAGTSRRFGFLFSLWFLFFCLFRSGCRLLMNLLVRRPTAKRNVAPFFVSTPAPPTSRRTAMVRPWKLECH